MIAKLIEYMSQLPICADLLNSRSAISHQLFNEKSPQIAVNQIDIYQVKKSHSEKLVSSLFLKSKLNQSMQRIYKNDQNYFLKSP